MGEQCYIGVIICAALVIMLPLLSIALTFWIASGGSHASTPAPHRTENPRPYRCHTCGHPGWDS